MPNSRLSIVLSMVLGAALGVGCAGSAKVEVKTGKVAKKSRSVPTLSAEVVAATPNIGVSTDLAAECKLQLADVGKTPKFEYDEFTLTPQDREVLDRVVTCVVNGPLTGRALRLVGRADPRGTQEYNLALGTKRASVVATYLKRSGMTDQGIVTTTRGDLDAEGKSETDWRNDRRVDIELMEDLKVTSSR